MVSTPVTRERFRILDELGIEKLMELYVDEVGTVRGLVGRLFKSHTKGGQPGVAEFRAVR